MGNLTFILELFGTVAFAISGAITGIRKNMDILGVCVLGVVTAIGGGRISFTYAFDGELKQFVELDYGSGKIYVTGNDATTFNGKIYVTGYDATTFTFKSSDERVNEDLYFEIKLVSFKE